MHINLTHRQAGLGVLSIATIGSWLSVVIAFLANGTSLAIGSGLVAAFLFTGLLAFYIYAEHYTRFVFPVLLIAYTLLIIMSVQEPFLTQQLTLAILTPSLLAAVLLDAPWVIGSGLVTLGGLIVRAGGKGPLSEAFNLLIFLSCIALICVVQFVAATALRRAKQNADDAEHQRQTAENYAKTIEVAHTELLEANEQQRLLIGTITDLETPVTRLADGVFFAPLVGHIDTRRAEALRSRLLEIVFENRAKLLIIDLSGVPDTDTAVSGAIIQTTEAVRLLGSEVVLSGISAPFAQTLTHMGVRINIPVVQTPQQVLEQHYLQGGFRFKPR